MDPEVKLKEDRKRFSTVLFMVHKGVLSALSAVAPITNCMMAENKFTSLCNAMNERVALLTATSNFLTYRRFENIFKSVCTDAGKEVARSGKEYTLFLAPKPIKGKPPDTGKMSGGQLQYLFKQVETSSKCGKHMEGDKKKPTYMNTARFKRF